MHPDPQRATRFGVPRVSVVIAAYNASGFIEESVEMILWQTLPDFELNG